MPEDTLQRLQATLKWMQWVTIGAVSLALIVLTLVMLFTMWNTYRLGEQAQAVRAVAVETHDSLCAFKINLLLTQRDAREFVRTNPGGLADSRGNILISRDQIDQAIENRQATLNSLVTLDCEGEVIP
jgi:hypothetical protein